MAGLRPGQRVLDVGTGRGAVLRPAARAVGPRGLVLGVDVSAGMAASTTADLAGRDPSRDAPAAVLVADAAAPPVTAGFDAVLGGMLVQFLPDPVAALTARAALVVPGGRLGLSWWAADDERFAGLDAVVAHHLPGGGARRARAFSRDVEASEAVVPATGWCDVVTVVEVQHVLLADFDVWWRWSWSHGQRQRWEAVPDPDRLRRDLDVELRSLAGPDGSVLYQPRAAFTLARVAR